MGSLWPQEDSATLTLPVKTKKQTVYGWVCKFWYYFSNTWGHMHRAKSVHLCHMTALCKQKIVYHSEKSQIQEPLDKGKLKKLIIWNLRIPIYSSYDGCFHGTSCGLVSLVSDTRVVATPSPSPAHFALQFPLWVHIPGFLRGCVQSSSKYVLVNKKEWTCLPFCICTQLKFWFFHCITERNGKDKERRETAVILFLYSGKQSNSFN